MMLLITGGVAVQCSSEPATVLQGKDKGQKQAEAESMPAQVAPSPKVNEATQQPQKVNESPISEVTESYFGKLDKIPVTEAVPIEPLKNGSVVLLIFDALNVGHMSAYGYERDTTPHISAFAENGLTLTNYISNSSWTRPSFTTIVTGLTKKQHGVELVGGWRLKSHIVSLAERFRDAGYRTAGFTGNPLVRKSWGFDQGYELYEGSTTRGIKVFPPDSIWVDAAQKWLSQTKNQPFFLMLFLTSAHTPYRPPKASRKFLSQVPKGKVNEHPYREYKKPLPHDEHARIVAAYDDEIAYMDTQVKRLLDHLEKIDRRKETVLMMTADHGEMMGEHNCYLHSYHMWEQTLKVPFIISAPNLPLKNAVDDRPFTHVDVVPTLLDFVGIDYDESELEGISLVKALADPKNNRTRVRYSQVNVHGVRRQAVRMNGWKLVHHHKVHERAERDLDRLQPSVEQPHPRDLPTLAWDNERWEMFNLEKDIAEQNNIYGSVEAQKQQTLLKKVLHQNQDIQDDALQDNALNPELIEALKNVGYMQ